MNKKIFSLLVFTLVLASLSIPYISAQSEPWETWNPDLSSPGVTLTEEFEGYRYDPNVVHGGTLTVSTPSDPPEQHQWNAGATASYNFLDPMSDWLVRIDPITGGAIPWIAEKWEMTADGLHYTIHLVKGVKFHDGTELTSEDVEWCFEYVMANNFTRMSTVWQKLNRTNPVEAIDRYTLRFNLKEKFVAFPRETLGIVAIVPKHVWEKIIQKPGYDWLTYTPTIEEQVNCGPFKLIEYVPNSYYKYEAFEDYWHGKPYVDYMIRPIITSGDAELLAVKRGDVDVFTGFLASEAIPGLLREEGIGLYLYNNEYMYHWGYNMAKWPFNVKEFRLALAHAIDKQDIVDTLLLGYGLPGSIGVEAPFYTFWYNPNVTQTYTFNMTKAAEMLDDLGYVDADNDGVREGTGEHAGQDIAFDIGPPIYDPVRCRAAELLAESFKQIGIKATVQYMEWATLWNKIIQPLDSPTKVDSWLLGSSQSVEPQWMFTRLHSSHIPNPNYYGFVNAEFDMLSELQSTQFNVDERRASVYRMQEILAEEVPLIVLYFRQSPSVYRTDKLTGWVKHYGQGMENAWNWINVRPIVQLKSMSVSVVNTPPPEVEIGESLKLGLKYVDPSGAPITSATVTAMVTGFPTPYSLTHTGGGTYQVNLDTSNWSEGAYTIRVDAEAKGFSTELTTFSLNAVPAPKPTPTPTPGPTPKPTTELSFWESYGATITGVVVVLAIIAVVAVYMYGRRT